MLRSTNMQRTLASGQTLFNALWPAAVEVDACGRDGHTHAHQSSVDWYTMHFDADPLAGVSTILR